MIQRWLAIAALGCLGGCASFLPPELPPPRKNENGETELNIGYLRRGATIEVEGHLEGGKVRATRIEIEEPDDELSLKGELLEWDGTSGRINGVAFRVAPKTVFRGPEGEDIPVSEVPAGAWVKAECRERNGAWLLVRLELRTRPEAGQVEVQGPVSRVRHGAGTLVVAEVVQVVFDVETLVVWDVADEPPPDLQEIQEVGARVVQRSAKGLRRVRRRDDDDRRPESQLTFGDVVTVGGEIQYSMEWRDNHDLREIRKRDRLIHQASTKLELSFDLTRHLFAFTQVRFSHDIVHFDQDRDLESEFDWRFNEAYVLIQDLPVDGFALQLGRQDVDYGREWVVDELLDAARAYVNFEVAVLDVSVSQVRFDSNRDQDGITNWLVGVFSEAVEDQELYGYFLHRSGGVRIDLDRYHAGFSAEGSLLGFDYWADVGVAWGTEDGHRVSGFGVDLAAMYTFEDAAVAPYVFAGFAWGSSGGSSPEDGFRQSGLHDNNDRFGGVTSYRYLGELVRPELSNLFVVTAGVGFRPGPRTSVDLVYHHYWQDETSDVLRDSRIRFSPNGMSSDLGDAVDLVIGIEDFRPVEIEIVLSYFSPGPAFGSTASDAWFMTVQVEWNF